MPGNIKYVDRFWSIMGYLEVASIFICKESVLFIFNIWIYKVLFDIVFSTTAWCVIFIAWFV